MCNTFFLVGKLYLCIKDVIAINNNQLAFKRGSVYKCIEENTLLGNNNVAYNIKICVKDYEHYFKPVINEDNVNHPSHYSWLKDKCGIEVIDVTRHLDFDLGNAVKYILRAGKKKDSSLNDKEKTIEDLKKAVWYINDKIKMLEKD